MYPNLYSLRYGLWRGETTKKNILFQRRKKLVRNRNVRNNSLALTRKSETVQTNLPTTFQWPFIISHRKKHYTNSQIIAKTNNNISFFLSVTFVRCKILKPDYSFLFSNSVWGLILFSFHPKSLELSNVILRFKFMGCLVCCIDWKQINAILINETRTKFLLGILIWIICFRKLQAYSWKREENRTYACTIRTIFLVTQNSV